MTRGEETVFSAVEATPEEVGLALARATGSFAPQSSSLRSHLRPDPFALVALPSSAAEREALLAVLTTKHEFGQLPRQREFAAMLLEGWGRPDEALALLEDDTNGIDPLHLTRLRFRVGDREGAAEAFAKAREGLEEWTIPLATLPMKSLALTWSFEALDQLGELAEFLEWLQPQCEAAHLANEILHLRLNTAYHRDALDGLLARLADEPPPLHDLARWSLTGDPAVLPADMKLVPAAYLPYFHRVSLESPTMVRIMETAIREGWGESADHLAILRHLLVVRVPTEPLLRLWFAQDERALAALAAALPKLVEITGWFAGRPAVAAELADLADRHPEHSVANLLSGRVLGRVLASRTATGRAAPGSRLSGVPHLLRAFDQAPLARGADEGLNTLSLLRANRPDIPGIAVEILADLLPPGELKARLTGHPDFAALPAPDQARYLALAKLDVPFIDALLGWDWSDAAHDRFGGWPTAYLVPLRSIRRPAGDQLARLRSALPAILAGSPGKSAASIHQQAEATRGLFPDDDEFKALLAELSALLDGDAQQRIEELAATLKPRTRTVPAKLPPAGPAEVLAFFSPPQYPRWLDHDEEAGPLAQAGAYAAEYLRQRVMRTRFPVFATNNRPGDSMDENEILARLWKLRALLPAECPQAVMVDWLVAHPGRFTTPLPPEDMVERATEHFDSWCERLRGPDIFIWNETAEFPPGERVDWSFLAKLENAPFAIRKQAAAILGQAAIRQQDDEAETLRQRLLGEAARPDPDAPAPDAEVAPEDSRTPEIRAALDARGANDPEAFVAALLALSEDDFGVVANVVFDPQCARIMSAAAAPRLLDFLAARVAAATGRPAATSLVRHDAMLQAIRSLHGLYQDTDPALAKRFRQVLLEFGLFDSGRVPGNLLADLASDMDRAGEAGRAEAVALLAAVVRGADASRDSVLPLRFPAAPPDPFALGSAGSSAWQAALRTGFCHELADLLASDDEGTATRDLAALLRYAARPDREAFRDGLLAIVERQPAHLQDASRSNLVTSLYAVAEWLPKAPEHLLMHAESTAAEGGFPNWSARSSRYPSEWTAELLATAWRRLATTGAEVQPPGPVVLALAPVMLEVAGDALWQEFRPAFTAELAGGSQSAMPPAVLGSLVSAALASGHPQRALEILRSLPELRSWRDLREIARTAWLLDDVPTLNAVGRKLGEMGDIQAMQDLGAELEARGQPADDAVPVFTIIRLEDGKPVLCWSMTSDADQRLLPDRPIPGMDGIFDLSIERVVGGERQPEPIEVEAIAARGSHPLPPMRGQSGNDILIVKVIRREDGHTLVSSSVSAPPEEAVSIVPAPPPAVAAPRPLAAPFEPMPPPAGVVLAADDAVKLADLPWLPGQGLTVGLWAVMTGAAECELHLLDADGKVLRTRRLYARSNPLIPKWQYLEMRWTANELAGGSRAALMATRSDSQSRGVGALWVTGLQATATEETASLPATAVPLGRLSAFPTAMTCSPDGGFLAFGMDNGRVVIMDAATGATGEFAPHRKLAIAALAMSGGRVVAVDRQAALQIMDLSTGGVRSPGALSATPEPGFNARIELSPDGEWLLWSDLRQTVQIIKLDDDRLGRAVTLPVGDRPGFTVDHWGGAVIASGAAGHFVVPFAAFAGLDPARLDLVAEFPAPRCAHRAPAADGRPGLQWEIPRHGLTLVQAGNGFRIAQSTAAVVIPATAATLAVAADGVVFFVAPGGLVHRLDSADLPAR